MLIETSEQFFAAALEWRGVEDPCTQCCGTGYRAYPNTAGWSRSGGASGQAITRGVCDECWGSGEKHIKGVDLRALAKKMRALEARVAELEALNAAD